MLVDDHFVVRMGLGSMLKLEPDIHVVAEACSGPEAIELQRKHRAEVILMDCRLPGMSGIEAAAAIRQEFPSTQIIMLSVAQSEEEIYRAIQAGAQAYLPKSVEQSELVRAIRIVRAGQRYLPAPLAARLAERVGRSELSERERETLELLVKGLSNKEIASALEISVVTVKLHVSNLLAKLGVADRSQAITAAIQRGIIQLDD
jgi:DNA-binding NarL/FixJ family response regulator